jgi:4-hydroxybenzoate polyprenyltransferase
VFALTDAERAEVVAKCDHLARLRFSPAASLAYTEHGALLASMPFLYGAWVVGRPRDGALLVVIAAPLHFAREVAKDLDDAEADAPWRRTLPVVYGARGARGIVVAAAVLFLCALVWPAAGAPVFALALVPAVALSLAAAGTAVRGRRGSPGLFKAAMVCAMLAVIAARP